MSNQYSCGCGYNYRRSMQHPQTRQYRDAMEQQPMTKSCCSMEGCALAMAYVPMQTWSRPLPPCKGLKIGTIFADLNKPFCGKGGAWS